MSSNLNSPEEILLPSYYQAFLFQLKILIFRIKKTIANCLEKMPRRFTAGNADCLNDLIEVAAESSSSLWTGYDNAELSLQAGKVHNLRIALRRINGITVPANEVFSFWAQLGRPSRWKGYVYGRELRAGCLIPSIGGGLCQLSNALYDAALTAGFEIIERHAHSRVIAGSLAELGRDATVFWNYVDLKFRSDRAFKIEARLSKDQLIVRFKTAPARRALNILSTANDQRLADRLGSCATCGQQSCFRNIDNKTAPRKFSRAAFLVDEYWPEFDKYINEQKSAEDLMAMPIDGKRFNKRNYRWNAEGFQQKRDALWTTFERSIACRKLLGQGANRQLTLLKYDEKLARSYAKFLTYDVGHITVMQNLLPYLWRDGHLGGRSFDVLMTRLPIWELQKRLDQAYQLNPAAQTLRDFRADADLIKAEQAALANAEKIITPHSEIAALFPDRAVLLDWSLPEARRAPLKGNKIIFPAATLARKGAYELRAAAQQLQLEITPIGEQWEGGNFWLSPIVNRDRKSWLDGAAMVVLPAYIEDKPRLLLEAVAHQIPVIASTACGLKNIARVKNIPAGDIPALRDAILSMGYFSSRC
jgi:hypothetical protein